MKFRLLLISAFLFMGSLLCAQEYQLSKPLVKVEGGSFFTKKTSVTLDFRLAGAQLYYTLDGTEPTKTAQRYRKTIKVKSSSTLKVKAFKQGFLPSETITTRLIQLGKKIVTATIDPTPSPSYAGKGIGTLIDQQSGSLNFRDGQWLGYNKGPVSIILDLGKAKPIQEVIVSTLTAPGAWIMPPATITAGLSASGEDFGIHEQLSIPTHPQNAPSGKTYYNIDFSGLTYRYVRLIIEPTEKLPEWHPGKGNAAWVFLDEIIVK